MPLDIRRLLFNALFVVVIGVGLLDAYRRGFDRNIFERIRYCNLSDGICLQQWGDTTTRVRLVPPRPTRDTPIRLEIEFVGADPPQAALVNGELTMPRMNMGDNRLEFRRLDSRTLVSELELPFCIFDQTFWQMTLRSPGFPELDLVFDSASTAAPVSR